MKLALIVTFVTFALLGATVDAAYITKFTVTPGHSDVLKSTNVNATAIYNKCEEELTAPAGIIEKFYERGTTKNDEKCTWIIKAPKDKVVNIDLLSFNLENDEETIYDNGAESTIVSFIDHSRPEGKQLLQQFFISTAEKISRFSETIRGKEILIEIKYHDHKDFSRQKIFIKYSFQDAN